MMRTLRAMLRKEFLQITRDRLMLRQVIAMPIVQLVILSSAATFEVKTARLWVVDQDQSTASRGLVDRMRASGRFEVTGRSASMDRANEALLTRDAGIILRVPRDFERDLERSGTARVQLVLNAEDGAAAGVTQAYATQIIRRHAAALDTRLRGERGAGAAAPPTIDVRARPWYNPELAYRDYMIPGILVQLVTVIGTLLTAMNIVREQEVGTLEQLRVTPLGRGTFIAAKLIPLWIIALVELALGLIVARLLFDVPIAGSLPLVFFAAAVYLTAALGLGLLVSTLVHTQQQAMFVTFFIIMVYLLMSGLFTPVRSMPEWAQWMAELNPLKHFIIVMRAVMLKGAGLGDIARELGILALFGLVMLSLAIRQADRRAV